MQKLETRSPGRPLIQWMIGAFLLLPLIGVAAAFLAGRHLSAVRQAQALAVYGTVADFELTEQTGAAFTRRDLLNSVWVADFVFTRCAGQCPRMTLAMSGLQKKLPAAVRFVSFSVDPSRDTPESLLQYAETYQAEKGRWFFLTGSFEEIKRVAASFYMTQGDDPNLHSTRFVLLDQESKIRGYYDQTDPGFVEKITRDVMVLLS